MFAASAWRISRSTCACKWSSCLPAEVLTQDRHAGAFRDQIFSFPFSICPLLLHVTIHLLMLRASLIHYVNLLPFSAAFRNVHIAWMTYCDNDKNAHLQSAAIGRLNHAQLLQISGNRQCKQERYLASVSASGEDKRLKRQTLGWPNIWCKTRTWMEFIG